jgi:hypothetical protein
LGIIRLGKDALNDVERYYVDMFKNAFERIVFVSALALSAVFITLSAIIVIHVNKL